MTGSLRQLFLRLGQADPLMTAGLISLRAAIFLR